MKDYDPHFDIEDLNVDHQNIDYSALSELFNLGGIDIIVDVRDRFGKNNCIYNTTSRIE